jgi:hypothetical protein
VHRYGWDPNEVNLIKARASMDYQQYISTHKQKVKSYWLFELSIVIMVIILVSIMFFSYKAMGLVDNTRPSPTVQEAIKLTGELLRDVNFDDKINCIDYAVVFYEVYPGAKIIRVWDNGNLNHLLNQVGDDYIEPQVRSGDPNILWRTFNTAFKKDQTYSWSIWATRRRW